MANLEINLDLLIQDCLKAYTEETLEFEVLMPVRSSAGQYDDFPVPLIMPEHILSFDFSEELSILPEHIVSFNSTEELSPVTPAEVSELPLNNRFICSVCSKPYRGKRELTRHMKKHYSPNKYFCTIDGCLQSTYRSDVMSSHIKTHEKRLKNQMKRNSVVGQSKKVIQKRE
jgi:uncharacterized Zn-finger protein